MRLETPLLLLYWGDSGGEKMKKLILGLLLFIPAAWGVTTHTDYHSSTVLHQALGGSYVAGDQVGDPLLIKAVGEKGGVIILENIVALDENENGQNTIHHFFEVEPANAGDSNAINFSGSEDQYLGRAVGSALVDVGAFSVGVSSHGVGNNSTVVLKLKNGSTGLYVVHEANGAPAYTSGKTKFRYYFRNQ